MNSAPHDLLALGNAGLDGADLLDNESADDALPDTVGTARATVGAGDGLLVLGHVHAVAGRQTDHSEVVVTVTALDVVTALVADLDHETASGGLDKTVLVGGG